MGEYGREQRRQLIRAIADSGTGSRQLKGIVDNRANKIRYIQKKIDNIVLKEGFPTSIVSQLVSEEEVKTSLRNVACYSPDMYRHYGEVTIANVLRTNDLNIRGHASGGSGDNQNDATTQDLARLRTLLEVYTAPEDAAIISPRPAGRRNTIEQQALIDAKKKAKKDSRSEKKRQKYEAEMAQNFGKRPKKS